MSELKKISCLIVDDEPLAREIIDDYCSKIDFLHIVGTCRNAIEAQKFMLNNQIDLLFLDINMPHISGIEYLKQLNPKPMVIFTTAYSEYALESYDLDAIDYLVKPITFQRFFKSVHKAAKWFGVLEETSQIMAKEENQNDFQEAFMYCKTNDKVVKIMMNDIYVVESYGHYVKIHTDEKRFVIHQSISQTEERLSKNFIRVHRSFIVNSDKILAYNHSEIETEIMRIPIGRSYKKLFYQKLNN
ncbi:MULTISPECIES: LytTR family DNA-binding domain-containing protein [Mangrovimonas]|uniref:LytR/AlgR family response regulator transcription factor n=1 Tax=Mangrovimonas TaxID=1211036 RepID=UPI0006B5E6E4|nr:MULTISPECIES: LytTR family DNA-binding domain-containing protein [Mangrovimonas]OMP29974.1 hypothetical protein BKM32_15330 [Mangrovimonas sp. DI 80]